MQSFINNPEDVVDEMLAGFVACNRDLVAKTANRRVLKYVNAPIKNKVGIVTGGGSGHKPAFIGYIGKNMIDAVAVGEVFTSPTAIAFLDAFREAEGGRGVACLYGNYAGDNMNVGMAVEMASELGMEVQTVVANDDVPSAPVDRRNDRRGVAGEVLMWKVGGAQAGLGAGLDEVARVAQKALDNTRSVGVGLAPCTIPAVGKPNFFVEPGTMEVGIGHHGEPGVEVTGLKPAREVATMMLDIVLPELRFAVGEEAVVLLSGLGATTAMELYIIYGEVSRSLEKAGIGIHRPFVGNLFTSLGMMGTTLTIMKVDDELKRLVDMEAKSVGIRQW